MINIKENKFYKTLIAISIPIIIQNLISSSLNMVDNIMIGKLGAAPIAAVGLANQFYFVFNLFVFGLNSGCAIFISQFWGKKDSKNIKRVLGICLILGIISGALFNIIAFFAPNTVMNIFTKDKEVINLGIKYLRIVSLSYVITAISFAFSFASRSIEEAKIPMITSTIALLCNTLLNYILIFGNFGFKPMGVEGAALATLIARIIEMITLIFITYKRKNALCGTLKEFTDFNKEFFKKIIRTIYPVVINEAFWAIGVSIYSIIYASISTDAVASYQIANTIQNIFNVACFGVASAAAVMIGNEIGAEREENGQIYGNKFMKITIILGSLMGILIFISSNTIVGLYNVQYEVIKSANIMLKIYSFAMIFKMLSVLFIVGILRAGGDTKRALLLEMSGLWLVGVPIAFIGAKILKLPVEVVVALAYLEDVVKLITSFIRFRSKKWIRNLVKNI